jgi:hypothetical protein
MATVAERATKLGDERRFFFYMAVAILITAVIGFGSDIVVRHVWFTDFPWPVHIHAAIFVSWVLLYVVQNWLVADGRNIALHRQLGWLGTGIATLMVPLGIAGTMNAIARGSVTGQFPLGFFLAMDVLGILGFGVLTFAALRLRARAGWHKRLMLCGTVLAITPALGRLLSILPLGGFMPFAVPVATILYILAGVVFDLVVLRRVHPAYWWGLGTVALVMLLTGPIGFSPQVTAFPQKLAG